MNTNRASLVQNLGMQSALVFSGRTDGVVFIRTYTWDTVPYAYQCTDTS
jgi:hypothetical protein